MSGQQHVCTLRPPRPLRRGRGRGDDGTTLVEVLVAVMILGVAVVGLLSALAFLYKATATHRQITTASSMTQQALEIVADPVQTPYEPCASAAPRYQAVLAAQGLTDVTVTEVRQWGDGAWQPCDAAAPSALLLQEVTVATHTNGTSTIARSAVKLGGPA